LAGITCLRSKPTIELAGIDTAGTIVTPSIAIVAVDAEVAALANTMFDTTVIVVVDGTVYRVVLDVAAAVLARA
jgi:diacylglycerol kinase family enzyme